MTTPQAFTLVELLIVIAIIALLAAVLLPTIMGARRAANNSSAQSLARNAVTRAEIQRSENNNEVVYASTTTCAPLMFSSLPSNVASCEIRQDESTSYALVKSSSGAYYQFDGEQLLGPLASAPASW